MSRDLCNHIRAHMLQKILDNLKLQISDNLDNWIYIDGAAKIAEVVGGTTYQQIRAGIEEVLDPTAEF